MYVRSAWLYTRGPESVRIEVRQDDRRFLLVVNGPCHRTLTEGCEDWWGVFKSQLAHEALLLAQGFALESSIGGSLLPDHSTDSE